ncbi:hypothetical protein EBZ39_03240 [bacterium]|nr:hypothetical protein [bacterium]
MALPTLLDLAKTDAGIGYDIIEESIQSAPELRTVPAATIKGTTMELTVRTGLPTVAFRNANEGVERSKSSYATKTFQTFILDHQIAVDKQVISGAKEPGRWLQNHATGAMEAAFRKIGSQFYYGTGHDAKGFPGLIAQYSADTDHEVNASGSSNKSSVWMVRLGVETLEFLFGNDQTIRMNDEWAEETVYDDSANPYQAWTNWMTGRLGLRLANKHAAVRIKNLAASTQVLNDTLLYEAYRKFTEFGFEPTHIFANGRSIEQLRASRTATNATGAPVSMPQNWEGIPIIRTASITNSEA